jgi:hypothetical protein
MLGTRLWMRASFRYVESFCWQTSRRAKQQQQHMFSKQMRWQCKERKQTVSRKIVLEGKAAAEQAEQAAVAELIQRNCASIQ